MTDVVENLFPSPVCVAAFSSNDDYDGAVLKFEFGNMLEAMGIAYVLFRDSTRYRHQYGILGVGTRTDVVDYLLSLSRDYPRLVLTGISAGSLAACMYAQLMAMKCAGRYNGSTLKNVEVVALSPYSDVGDPDGAFGADWQSRGPWKVHTMSLLSDISVIFDEGSLVKTRAFYSDGDNTHLDRWHAERLGITDLTLIPGASHANLGKLMRDSGQLQKVLLGEPL